jgi:hypothetical protein
MKGGGKVWMETRRRESTDLGKTEGNSGCRKGGRKLVMEARQRESREVGKAMA